MPRDYRISLDDIAEAIRRIQTYVKGMSQEDFQADPKTSDAVIRNLEIVGEAIKNLPAEVRARAAHIPWGKIAGLRDILIHAYFGIDLPIIWDVVMNKLPDLEESVGFLLHEAEPGGDQVPPP